uniref:Origin recognition complex subunit 6 n=1 Tax=Cyprinus carpio TaxID=7962 RepID=A0A8C2IJB8_CYPCA
MDKELFRKLASRVGITAVKVLSQAEEYMRLSQVKCVGLGSVTATSKTIICLELAATSMKFPLDKEYAIKLSGLSPKVYSSNLKAVECMLGLQSNLGLRDLAVQYGCLEAVKVASQILQRYETSLPAAQRQDLDLSKPLFTTAALYAACKCMKIRADRKLASSSGAKKGIFDRLWTQFQKFGQEICNGPSSMEKPVKTAQKRQKTLTELLEVEEDGKKAICLPQIMANYYSTHQLLLYTVYAHLCNFFQFISMFLSCGKKFSLSYKTNN